MMKEMEYKEVKNEFDNLITLCSNCEDGFDYPEALCIEEEIVKTICFTFGGPNTFAEIVFNTRGEVVRGRYVKAWGIDKVEIPISYEDAEAIASAYGLLEY